MEAKQLESQLHAERRCLSVRFPAGAKVTLDLSFAPAPSQTLKLEFKFSLLQAPLTPKPASLQPPSHIPGRLLSLGFGFRMSVLSLTAR